MVDKESFSTVAFAKLSALSDMLRLYSCPYHANKLFIASGKSSITFTSIRFINI